MKYNKKGNIEAIQYTGDNVDEITEFIGGLGRVYTTTSDLSEGGMFFPPDIIIVNIVTCWSDAHPFDITLNISKGDYIVEVPRVGWGDRYYLSRESKHNFESIWGTMDII